MLEKLLNCICIGTGANQKYNIYLFLQFTLIYKIVCNISNPLHLGVPTFIGWLIIVDVKRWTLRRRSLAHSIYYAVHVRMCEFWAVFAYIVSTHIRVNTRIHMHMGIYT